MAANGFQEETCVRWDALALTTNSAFLQIHPCHQQKFLWFQAGPHSLVWAGQAELQGTRGSCWARSLLSPWCLAVMEHGVKPQLQQWHCISCLLSHLDNCSSQNREGLDSQTGKNQGIVKFPAGRTKAALLPWLCCWHGDYTAGLCLACPGGVTFSAWI